MNQTKELRKSNRYECLNYILEFVKRYNEESNDNIEETSNEEKTFQFLSIMILYFLLKEESLIYKLYNEGKTIGLGSNIKMSEQDLLAFSKALQKVDMALYVGDTDKYTFDNIIDFIDSEQLIINPNINKEPISKKTTERFQKIIWLIHKIRDSFAHASTYSFQEGVLELERIPKEEIDSTKILYDEKGIKIYNKVNGKMYFYCDISYETFLELINLLNETLQSLEEKYLTSQSKEMIEEVHQKLIETLTNRKTQNSYLKEMKEPAYTELSYTKNGDISDESLDLDKIIECDYIDKIISGTARKTKSIIYNELEPNYYSTKRTNGKNLYTGSNRIYMQKTKKETLRKNRILLENTTTIPEIFLSEISNKINLDKKTMLYIIFFNTFFTYIDNELKENDEVISIKTALDLLEKISIIEIDNNLFEKINKVCKLCGGYSSKETIKKLINKTREEIAKIESYKGKPEYNELKQQLPILFTRLKKYKNILNKFDEIEPIIKNICSTILTKMRNSFLHCNWKVKRTENEQSTIIEISDIVTRLDNNIVINETKFKCEIDIENLYLLLKEMIPNSKQSENKDSMTDEELVSNAINIILKIAAQNNKQQLHQMFNLNANSQNNTNNKSAVV